MSKSSHCIAIIQARMGSSRLPGKVLLDLAGQPMLVRVLERVQRARLLDQVVVATTTDASDDLLVDFCRERGYSCLRGNQFDVLDRYYQVALQLQAQVVVRITGDCPLIDPGLIDEAIAIFQESRVDFLANRLPPPFHRSFPIGLDIEMCTFAALERAWHEADQMFEREHVMPYLYEGVILQPESPTRSSGVSPHGFRVLQLQYVPNLGDLRWTVDTVEDLAFVQQVFSHFNQRDDFTWLEALVFIRSNPDLARINASVPHKHLHQTDERGR